MIVHVPEKISFVRNDSSLSGKRSHSCSVLCHAHFQNEVQLDQVQEYQNRRNGLQMKILFINGFDIIGV